MPTIKVNNHQCHYQFDDFGHRETLVFSNSLGCNLSMWEGQLDYLADHTNILRYDTRGHGKSEVTPGEYSVELLGTDVLELTKALKIDKFSFCGLSMGGLIAQWLGLNAPDRLDHLILSNTSAKIGTQNGWNTRIVQVREKGMESLVEGSKERWFSEEFRNKYPQKVSEFIQNNLLQTSPEGYMANCSAVRDADFRDSLNKITTPTLIISGIHDATTTVRDGYQLQQKMGNTSHILLDASHLSNIEKVKEFSAHILFILKH